MSTKQTAHPAPVLPSTEALLAQGGDERIVLDPHTQINQYGCRPFPDPELAALGSSTASVISNTSYAAAQRLRRRLLEQSDPPAVVYQREIARLRQEIRALCRLDDQAGTSIVFAASGTDLHLIAGQLVGASTTAPTLAIMVDPAETGRHVPTALAGRNFCARTPLGKIEQAERPIIETNEVQVATVPIRQADGLPRPLAEVDAEVEALAQEAAARGQRVMLVLADVSKTGLIAPSPACALKVQRSLAGSVDVLVDACQFRIAPATLRNYLTHGFMVAVTGSKFVTGPCFSAALFLPAQLAERFRQGRFPHALQAFSARADWPEQWPGAHALHNVANFGLLLRWEAALVELQAFRSLSDEAITGFLTRFAAAVEQRLQHDPCFLPLPVPPLARGPLQTEPGWDCIQTIFPFVLCHPDRDTVLNREQTAALYRQLQSGTGMRFQLGQPVACGHLHGTPVSALRLCASARLAVEAAASPQHEAQVIERALAALDQIALLIREMPA